MRIIAAVMLLSGVVVGTGGALQFLYSGPGAAQFWAGVAATPAGVSALTGGIALWQRGLRAKRFVVTMAILLLAGTAVATALQVMGPPATLMGLAGGLPPLVWAWKNAGVNH